MNVAPSQCENFTEPEVPSKNKKAKRVVETNEKKAEKKGGMPSTKLCSSVSTDKDDVDKLGTKDIGSPRSKSDDDTYRTPSPCASFDEDEGCNGEFQFIFLCSDDEPEEHSQPTPPHPLDDERNIYLERDPDEDTRDNEDIPDDEFQHRPHYIKSSRAESGYANVSFDAEVRDGYPWRVKYKDAVEYCKTKTDACSVYAELHQERAVTYARRKATQDLINKDCPTYKP